ncbi:hypothetical protein DERP_010425 [Dermatophagoides pteronyssinus]|uniref:LITAF domain-containing protein n=1 Tax=Dermatophagoides pteronyssinus TaxID=6956 RepID=A0ABQ8J554_DERPT|nr:hypothetical protein DERP_010425 [Dermatophagoides pteronyssinus]
MDHDQSNNRINKPINEVPKTNYSTMLLKELKNQMALTREPIEIDCPECKNKTMTRTQQVNGQLTYLICVLCTLGCWCGLLPMIIDDFKDIKHNCSNCGAIIGTHYLRL